MHTLFPEPEDASVVKSRGRGRVMSLADTSEGEGNDILIKSALSPSPLSRPGSSRGFSGTSRISGVFLVDGITRAKATVFRMIAFVGGCLRSGLQWMST